MAELIPLEYRFEASRAKLIARWIVSGALIVVVCAGSLAYAYAWKKKQGQIYEHLTEEFRAKSVLMAQAKELQARRLELAARMLKMQELMDDTTVVSLLRSVSEAFSSNDCLEYINVQAHGTGRNSDSDDNKYAVHITGITKSYSTNADLLNRMTELGAKASPPVVTTPESAHLEPMLDGNVMRVQILCEKPDAKRG